MKCKGYFKQFKESLTEEQIRAVRMSTEKIAEKLDGENVPDTNAGKNDRWIPVTERLPEEGENVLGWIERDKWDNFDKPTKAEECAIGWQIEGRWHFDGYASRGTKCLAWLPLPAPYTAG